MPPAEHDEPEHRALQRDDHRHEDDDGEGDADRQHGSCDEEVGDRAGIVDAGLDHPAPQHLHVALVFFGRAIVLRRVVEQALNGLQARAAQRALIVGLAHTLGDAGGTALDGTA